VQLNICQRKKKNQSIMEPWLPIVPLLALSDSGAQWLKTSNGGRTTTIS